MRSPLSAYCKSFEHARCIVHRKSIVHSNLSSVCRWSCISGYTKRGKCIFIYKNVNDTIDNINSICNKYFNSRNFFQFFNLHNIFFTTLMRHLCIQQFIQIKCSVDANFNERSRLSVCGFSRSHWKKCSFGGQCFNLSLRVKINF